MSLNYKIDKFQTDPDDPTKTLVGLAVSDASGNLFIIDKTVTTGSKSDEQLVTAAQSAAQAEIDAWASSNANVGKTWNPETNSFE